MPREVCDFISVDESKVARIRRAIQDDGMSQRMAETLKVLADPTRLKIVTALEMEELCVCDIAALVGMNQSSVSHHLQNLRQMDIVRYRRDGKMAFYSLSDSHIRAMLAIARDHARELR
jgi:DNA-binding transcriptional ArsR family regulator